MLASFSFFKEALHLGTLTCSSDSPVYLELLAAGYTSSQPNQVDALDFYNMKFSDGSSTSAEIITFDFVNYVGEFIHSLSVPESSGACRYLINRGWVRKDNELGPGQSAQKNYLPNLLSAQQLEALARKYWFLESSRPGHIPGEIMLGLVQFDGLYN